MFVLLAGSEALQAGRRLFAMEELADASRVSDGLFDATEALGVERGIAYSLANAPDGATAAALRADLAASRERADDALRAAVEPLRASRLPGVAALAAACESQRAEVVRLRAELDAAASLPLERRDPTQSDRWFEGSSALILRTQDLWMGFNAHSMRADPVRTLHIRFSHALRIVADYAGREQALIGRLLVRDATPTPDEQAQLLRWHGGAETSWYIARTLADQSGLSPENDASLKDAESHYQTVFDMMQELFYVPGAVPQLPYPVGVAFWLDLSAQATESLDALRAAALAQTRRYIETRAAEARADIALHLALLALALGLSIRTFRVIGARVLRPIEGMVDALVAATRGAAEPGALADPRQDEIGKLAAVLAAFQRNSAEIARSADALAHYAHALERSNKELDDFAYIASHDLKEPLRGIHNHARFLMEDNEGKLDPDSSKRVDRLIYLSQRMERLVNDLLYFSRLGRQDLAVQSTDLNAVVHDIEGTLETFLEERGAKIRMPAPLPTVRCDKTRVTELLRNLVTNGIKYNESPEKVVEIGYSPERPARDGTLARHVFWVRDNGLGIAPEFHEDVFRIFKRLQSAKDGAQEGTGVGLTFVKKIVERHGGTLWIESALGAGSVFCFTLGEDIHADDARAA
jgi:signal transduction histidine kinase